MMALIDQDPVLPMRLTNRQGLLGDRTHGFHTDVDGDAFTSGYVDIDDLLAGDDLGFQMLLVHFLTERAATRRYAQRLGTKFSDVEFEHGHALGIEAEARILREYFNDATIHIVQDSPSVMIRRLFQNNAGVSFRRRITIGTGEQRGVDSLLGRRRHLGRDRVHAGGLSGDAGLPSRASVARRGRASRPPSER